jgi:hypothetical protein
MSKNLVELMAKAYFTSYAKEPFKNVLACVKEHIGEVAEVCKWCGGSGHPLDSTEDDVCNICFGVGIIARKD